MAVALIASSVALGNGAVVAQESEESQTPLAPSVGASAAAPTTTPGGWWDGSGVLAAAPPAVVEQGWCASYGGWLGLFAGGPLAKVCAGDAVEAPGGSVSGSPRGVGWFEGFDADGRYAGVELFGAPAVAADTYQALGEFDVIFDGGTVTVDFSQCSHHAGDGWSLCRTLVASASLPPGMFVGAATLGIEVPVRSLRGASESPETPATERAALVALYEATSGADWRYNHNWNTNAPVSDWDGVTTDSNGSVAHLYLPNNTISAANSDAAQPEDTNNTTRQPTPATPHPTFPRRAALLWIC